MKLIIILLLTANLALAQEAMKPFKWGVKGGFIFGGPIPTKSADNFEGSPAFGPFGSFYCDIMLSSTICFHPEVSIAIKGVSYKAEYRRDTLVEAVIQGHTGTVPTFYNAYLSGDMSLTYLDIPVYLSYYISGVTTVYFGVQSSFLIGGSNTVNAHVVIGEGGFYDDFDEKYNTYDNIRSFDFAICLGGTHNIFKDLLLGFYASRSLVPLYKPGTINNRDIDVGLLYNT